MRAKFALAALVAGLLFSAPALGRVVEASDFGVKCDNVADTAPQIQAAIDYANSLNQPTTVRLSPTFWNTKCLIATALVLKPRVSLDARGVIIKATASMEALLVTGVGASAITEQRVDGGRWECNNLANTRGIWIKEGSQSHFQGLHISECNLAYFKIGSPGQSGTSFEIFLQDSRIERSATVVPSTSYGVESLDSAADIHILNNLFIGVSKGIYGHIAHWKIAFNHVWNWTPGHGLLVAGYHGIDFGGANLIGNQVDADTETKAIWLEGGGIRPYSVVSNQVNCKGGADNFGAAITIGTGGIVSSAANVITCNAANRYAAIYAGDLTKLTSLGDIAHNVVTDLGPRINGVALTVP